MKTPQAPLDKVILGIDPGTNVLGYGVLHIQGKRVEVKAMGVIDLRRCKDVYLKLGRIYEQVTKLLQEFLPDELSIEAPFFGKNVQSMLKLGRAQGVAMAAAISRDIPIFEYAPLKIKMSITGNGRAAKEQVAYMLQKILLIPDAQMLPQLDASDGLAAALCHFYQSGVTTGEHKYSDWKDFANKNQDKVRK